MFRKPYLFATILLCTALRLPAQTAPNNAVTPQDVEPIIPFAATTGPTSWIPLDVKVNGKGPYRFLLDSGFDACCVTPDLAAELGIKPARSIKLDNLGKKTIDAGFVGLDMVQFGEVTFRNAGCVITPLPSGMPFRGVLGADVFANLVVTVDYHNKQIVVHNPATYHYEGNGFSLPIEFDTTTGIPILPASIDGIAARFAIDTGDNGGLTLFGDFVESHHLKKRYASSLFSTLTETTIGISKTVSTIEPALALGACILRHFSTELREPKDARRLKADGSIGGAVLQRFTVTFDYNHKAVWFEPNADFDAHYSRERSGLIIHYEQGAYKVRIVYAGSPASLAGIHTGDQVTRIDGKDAARVDLLQWNALVYQTDGTSVHLTVKRGKQTREVTLVLKGYK